MDPLDELTTKLRETSLGTKSAANKVVKDYRCEVNGFHHCLTCRQDFDDYFELRSHVNKKKHRMSKAKLKGLFNEFIEERLGDTEISTYKEAARMFEEDGEGEWRPFTPAEKSTWCRYLVFHALMETFG
jgi:hypothetical protein